MQNEKSWQSYLWYLHIKMQNQTICTEHYTVLNTLTLFFINETETFPININLQAIVALDDIRKYFSTDGRWGKEKSDPALQMRTALNPQGDGAVEFVTAKGGCVCGDPLFKCWQHIID